MKSYYIFLLTILIFPGSMILAQDSGDEGFKPALLVIDVQNKYIPMMSEEDQNIAPEYINGFIWLFRQHDLP